MSLRRVAAAIILFCLPITAAAQSGLVPNEPWYKVIVGVVAIPAAMLGLVYSYRLLRRTNLESRKLELEIQEKESKFEAATETTGLEVLKELAGPIGFSQRISVLILRFIILEMTLRLWNLVPAAFGKLLYFAGIAFFVGSGDLPDLGTLGGATLLFGVQLFDLVFDSVYWFILFGFGWPLLKDVTAVMGISLKGVFDLPFFWRRKKTRRA